MALNVKAAMLICMGFIAGMSWVVRQVEAPRADVRPPLIAHAVPTELAPGTRVAGPLAGDADHRAAWARQFERPNPLDVQADASLAAGDSLALRPPASSPDEGARFQLPPLVYDPRQAVASAEPAEPEPLPGPAEPVMLAAVTEPQAAVAEAPPAPGPKRYRVAKGDTLTGIARREWSSDDGRLVRLLLEANPKLAGRTGGRIRVGEELLIPDAKTAERVLAGQEVKIAAGPADVGTGTSREQWYTIQRSDTLASIAKRFLNNGRRWPEIAAANRWLNPNKIFPGMRIKLPALVRLAQR